MWPYATARSAPGGLFQSTCRLGPSKCTGKKKKRGRDAALSDAAGRKLSSVGFVFVCVYIRGSDGALRGLG